MKNQARRLRSVSWSSFLLGAVVGICTRFLPHQEKQPVNGEIEVLFTYPKSFRSLKFIECERKIIRLINDAQRSVYVQSYSFTSKNIVQALITAKKRGVDVQLLLDKENEIKPSDGLLKLISTGLPVKIRRIPGIAHSKIIIIDEQIVQTGSYNYTRNANERNDENIIILYNSPAIVKLYLENWHKCNLEASYVWGSTQYGKPWRDTNSFIPKVVYNQSLANQCNNAETRDIEGANTGNVARTKKRAKQSQKPYLEWIQEAQNSVWVIANTELLMTLIPTLEVLYRKGIDIRVLLQQDNDLPESCNLNVRSLGNSRPKLQIIVDRKASIEWKKNASYSVKRTKLDKVIYHFRRVWNDARILKTG
jgi:phosphatidylserine/phosphatidylglycerophosphate/cardiolipin synthase-like enzyme